MLLSFWMNLYFIFILFNFTVSITSETNVNSLLYFVISLIPLLVIAVRKKFEIPFFYMYSCLTCIFFFFYTIPINLLLVPQSATSDETQLTTNVILTILSCNIPTIVALLTAYFKQKTKYNRRILHLLLNILALSNTILYLYLIKEASLFRY